MNKNIRCNPSLESFGPDSSNEQSQHSFHGKKKKE